MTETATILNRASSRSLVILDELGRGTSTFDGVAIAYAVVEFLRRAKRCLTLFSTHYHMLLHRYHGLERDVDMYHMACMASDGAARKQQVEFLYNYTRGISPKSYGMNVALLAGLDPAVVDRATDISEEFERRLNLGEEKERQKRLRQHTRKQLTKREVRAMLELGALH